MIAGHLGDADQRQDVEMFEGLRFGPVIGGDDQQHPVDRQDAGEYVRQKPPGGRAHRQSPTPVPSGNVGGIGKAEIDRQPALLLLGQPIGVDPRQGPHQRGLAVVDMAGGGEDHSRSS